jgi:hypothetical protein
MTHDLIKAISGVKTAWSLSAFAIAAIVLFIAIRVPKAKPGARKTLVGLAVLVVLLAFIPIGTDTWVQLARNQARAVYRIQVVATDERGERIDDVVIRSTPPAQTSTASDGVVQLSIPVISLPHDGKLTIWATKPSAFLTGESEIVLASDFSPAVSVTMHHDTTAEIGGIVQDERGKAVYDATVSVVGVQGEPVQTKPDGSFRLPTHAAKGQQVMLHVEKNNYKPLNVWQIAGDLSLVLELEKQ